MTGSHHGGKKWFTCRSCDKHAYPSKKDAKTALRNNPFKAGMRVYKCPIDGTYWHQGHPHGYSREQHREWHEGGAS